MKITRPAILLGLLALLAPGTSPGLAAPGAAPLVIRGATVVTMEGAATLPDHTVVVVDGRIDAVGPDAEIGSPPNATVVDARGRFLLPGLADMHAHLGEADLILLLAHGVTTAREMNGSERHLAWRREIEVGERLGPRLVVASPLLAGAAVEGLRHEVLSSPEAARRRVGALAASGYDLLKVYDGLDEATYDALVREASSQGLPVAGHIPADVGLLGTLHARQDLEHVEKIVHAARGRLDASTVPFLAGHVRDAGVRVTPTLAAQRALALAGTEEYRRALEAPTTRWISASTLEWWRSLADHRPRGHGDPGEFYRLQEQLAVALLRAGVPLLAGSDAPNPLMVPGVSLVDELRALVDAGLDRREALQLATVNAGRYLREALELPVVTGVVRAGAAADLVLVDEDPLRDLETLRRPRGVVAGGRWLDRQRLDAMLDEVERLRGGGAASTGGGSRPAGGGG